MDGTVSNVCILPVVQKVATLVASIISSTSIEDREKKIKIKGKSAYCLKVPYLPWRVARGSPITQWSYPIQGGNKDSIFWILQMLSRTERTDSSFRRIPSRDQRRPCTGRCLRGTEANTHPLVLSHWTLQTMRFFEKFKLRWMKSALAYLQIWSETGGLGLHRCRLLWAWFPVISDRG